MKKFIVNVIKALMLPAAFMAPSEAFAFDYKITTNTPDTTLNGLEVVLFNKSEFGTEFIGNVENGVIEITGQSDRTFPAQLTIFNRDPENRIRYQVDLIVEPGEMVVSAHDRHALKGGALNAALKEYDQRKEDCEFRRDALAEICMETMKKNLGNGLAEEALMDYAIRCSPQEWNEALSLFDEETRNHTAVQNMTERKERLLPVWEGQPFTEVIGKALDGSEAKLSDFVGKGKYVVVDLWASWCGACIKDAKTTLVPLYEQYKESDKIQFLGIAMDDVNAAVAQHGIPWPQITQYDRLMATYGVFSLPEIILFAPDGTILRRFLSAHDLPSLLPTLQ